MYIIQWRRNNNVKQRADKAPQTDSEEVAITKALPRARRAGQGEEEEIDEARGAWIDRRGEVRALEREQGGFHAMQCSVLQQKQRRQWGRRTNERAGERTNGRPRPATSAYPAFFIACADDGDLTLRASTGWMLSSRMDDQVSFVDSLHTIRTVLRGSSFYCGVGDSDVWGTTFTAGNRNYGSFTMIEWKKLRYGRVLVLFSFLFVFFLKSIGLNFGLYNWAQSFKVFKMCWLLLQSSIWHDHELIILSFLFFKFLIIS